MPHPLNAQNLVPNHTSLISEQYLRSFVVHSVAWFLIPNDDGVESIGYFASLSMRRS